MWLSRNFGSMYSKNFEGNALKVLDERFDFSAPEDSDPTVMTVSEVLYELGIEQTKKNQITLSKILIERVGRSRRCRYNGRLGRFYALPPRRVPAK